MNQAFFVVKIAAHRKRSNKVSVLIKLTEQKYIAGEMVLSQNALYSLKQLKQLTGESSLIIRGALALRRGSETTNEVIIFADECISPKIFR